MMINKLNYKGLIFIFFATIFLNSCKKDGFPVPPASTVPQFTYTLDNDSYAPATITITNTSIVPEENGDATYIWDFGDGSTSNAINPTHTFTLPGTFEVKLTIKTTISQEIVSSTQEIAILNKDASGIAVYFTDGSNVYKGYLNNDKPVFATLPIGPFSDSYDLAIDTVNAYLYISDFDANAIYRCDLDGNNLTTFRSGLDGPDGLAIDFTDGKLYWDTNTGIQRTSLSSTSETDVEDFVTDQSNDPEGVSVDETNRKLYWTNYNGGLWSINLDGSNKTELLTDVEGGSTLIVGNRVYFDYYVESGNSHLKSTALDGTGMSTITTGISKVVFGIGYESKSEQLYWGDRSAGKIMRVNIDGSNIETWYTKAGSSPRGIVFGKVKSSAK